MCDQHYAKFLTYRVLSWITLLYFFLLHGFGINLYLRKSCYTNTSLNRTTPWCWPLSYCIVQSFDFNYALYKAKNSLRRTIDTFKTANGPLRSALGKVKNTAKQKCRCTTWQVIAIKISKLHTHPNTVRILLQLVSSKRLMENLLTCETAIFSVF